MWLRLLVCTPDSRNRPRPIPNTPSFHRDRCRHKALFRVRVVPALFCVLTGGGRRWLGNFTSQDYVCSVQLLHGFVVSANLRNICWSFDKGKRQSQRISAILRKTSTTIAKKHIKILARKIPNGGHNISRVWARRGVNPLSENQVQAPACRYKLKSITRTGA